MKNKKIKLNYRNIILGVVMIASFTAFITDWLSVIVLHSCFTWFGLYTNILFLGVACMIYDYLIEYAELKEQRRIQKDYNEFLERIKNL